MNILYHMPSLDNIYAGRTIYHGFKDAFEDMGHNFITYTNSDNLEGILSENSIDIFITSSHFYYQKAIDLDILQRYRTKGLKVLVNVGVWENPFSKIAVREGTGLKDDKATLQNIKNGKLGDYYFSFFETDDSRVIGFERGTGHKYHCIPLAANKKEHFFDYDERFDSQISFLGSFSKNKIKVFNEVLFPLKKTFNLRLYGQDWTSVERFLGKLQRIGQFFGISFLSKIQKPKIDLSDERKIYSSSLVNLNFHEWPQLKYGGDCNERTFKIPLCGGFQIVDDVACIKKYFKEGEEIIIAKDKQDWLDKIDFYTKNPDKRLAIIEAGRNRVIRNHTYHNRVEQILNICSGTI